ncbi:hypothetical protein EK21DRAFT_114459 [Setomelanomma holmii]|uniref:Uncharacterized protein n=1 Tax=Setomelanomma holmii TaxID=210430 RepID=A0A9P4LLB4_9PLEO|nr:hypothetical protein EK21DRAFT_114459 [Setomelanomma holmii]
MPASVYIIVPDYSSRSVQGIFVETARSIIQMDQNLDVLSFAATARGELSPLLPPWVPDWRSAKTATWHTMDRDVAAPWTGYNVPDVMTYVRFANHGSILEVLGIFVEQLVVGLPEETTPPLEGGFFRAFAFDPGHVVRTHQAVQPLDEIWIIPGVRLPVVLRPYAGYIDTSPAHMTFPAHYPNCLANEKNNSPLGKTRVSATV